MKKGKLFLDKSFIAGILAIAFGGSMAVVYKTTMGTYPLLVFLLLVVLGILAIVSALRASQSSCVEKIPLTELAVMLLLFANPLLAKTVGFYLSGAVSIYIIMQLFDPPATIRQAVKSALFTVCTTAGVYLIFTVLLRISTPKGLLI